MDKEFVNEVNKIIFDFIWKGKDKVKRRVLVGGIEDGGLKAPNLDSIVKTQRLLCCRKLASDGLSSWKIILLHCLKPVGGKFILGCNFDVKKLPIKFPGFYEECLKDFSRCSAANKVSLGYISAVDISKIILWNNCYILIGGKTVFNKRLVDKGIVRIGNLIAENNEIVTSKLRELNLSPLDAFQLFSVIDALPKDWRHALKSYGYDRLVSFDLHEQTQLFLSGKEVLLSNADSKGIYKEIRDREIVQPTAQKKYVEFFENDDLNWKEIYSLPYQVAFDTKSREFQYKLLHRYLAANDFLNRIGISSSQLCSLYDGADGSLEHLFVSCQITQSFGTEVIKWCSNWGWLLNTSQLKIYYLGKRYIKLVSSIYIIADGRKQTHVYGFSWQDSITFIN